MALDVARIKSSDLGLTTLLLSVGLLGTGGAAANHGQTAPMFSYILVIVAFLPILVSRRFPVLAATLTGMATVGYVGLGYAYGPSALALVVVTYRFAAGTPIRRAVAGAALLVFACLGAVAARSLAGLAEDWADYVAAAACVAVPAAVGVAVKVRRDATADVRDEQSRRAISEERLRLAQEMHDMVGQGLAVIAMQAGVALRALDREPARVRQALETIRAASKDALDGVRAELAALREPDLSGSPLRPSTGLADLPALAERMRSSGLPITTEIHGAVTELDLPVEVDRSAYRIVQESLTNVLRHGGPEATARICVTVEAGVLRLEVTDTGRGGMPGAGGQGICGMRARAQALGGSLETGSGPHGGFAVHALLPVPDLVTSAPREHP